MDSTEAKRQREAFLISLYLLTNGYRLTTNANMWEIGAKLKLDNPKTEKIVDYLINEGLVEYTVAGGVISLTHFGIQSMEESGKLDPLQVNVRRAYRTILLKSVYEIEQKTTRGFVEIRDLRANIQWTDEEFNGALQYLEDEALLNGETSGVVSLTHNGKKTVEEILERESSKIEAKEESKSRVCQVFLCHASEDKDAVREYYKRLLAAGFSPWLDEVNLLPGQDWDLEIRRAVRSSQVIIVFLSKKSVQKRGYFQKETRQVLDIADEQPEGTIFVIPTRINDCEVPDRLLKLQYVNLFEPNGFTKLRQAIEIACPNAENSNSSLTEPESKPQPLPKSNSTQSPEHNSGIDISGGNINASRDIIAGNVIHNYGDQTTTDHQREQTLQSYLDKMTELLDKGLLKSELTSELRVLARTRTLTALRSLDPDRQFSVLRFLREISKGRGNSSTEKTDSALAGANPDAFLFRMESAYLPTVKPGADFSDTYLWGVRFQETNLSGINFSHANLCEANLVRVNLSEANLNFSNFTGAVFMQCDFTRVVLQEADLRGAYFSDAIFEKTGLLATNLEDALFIGSDQLCPVLTLFDTTMPNGQKWEGEVSGPYTAEDLAPYFKKSRNK